MSTRAVRCPGCQSLLKVKAELTRVRCPKCQASIDTEADDASAGLPAVASAAPPPLPGQTGRESRSVGRSTAAHLERPPGAFPSLEVSGPGIDPKSCIEPGTGLCVALGYLGVSLGIVALALSTMGIGLIALLFAPLINWLNQRKALALIHGSGLQVGPEQFPEIHACVEALWERMGKGECPDVYIIEASVMNAFAVKHGRKNVILLTDDIVHGCMRSGDPRTLAFVLAHELAHAALGHNGSFRSTVRSTYKKLSRLDEYTADRVAMRLMQDRQTAVEGIVLLTVGPHLLPYINYEALDAQVSEVLANKNSVKAEKPLTHPLLLHRLDRALNDSLSA